MTTITTTVKVYVFKDSMDVWELHDESFETVNRTGALVEVPKELFERYRNVAAEFENVMWALDKYCEEDEA